MAVIDPLAGLGTITCDTTPPATLVPGATLDRAAYYVVRFGYTSITNTVAATAVGIGPVYSSVTVNVAADP